MSFEGLAKCNKMFKEADKERADNLTKQARVDVFVKLLDKHKSLPIERFSRNEELEVLIAESKNIAEELLTN